MSLPVGQFTKYFQGLGNVSGNTGDCNILCLGDSITSGWFDAGWNANYRPFSYPALFGKLLANKTGLPVATQNYASADTGTGGSHDSRVVLTGAMIAAAGPFSLGSITWQANGATGTLTFTPGDGLSYDTVTVVGQRNSGTATYSVTVNGGVAQNYTFPTDNLTRSNSFTGTASTSASTVISWVSGNCNIYAVIFTSSTQRRINVFNSGVGGALTTDFFGIKAAPEIVGVINPALITVSLGINDSIAATYVPVYQANMQNLINALQSTTTGIVVTTPATGIRGGAALALQNQYQQNVIQTFQQGYPIADFAAAIGNNTNFFGNSDHPNQAGYNLLAQTLVSVF